MAQPAPIRDHFYRILGVAAALVFTLAWVAPSLGTSADSTMAAAAPDAVVTSAGATR